MANHDLKIKPCYLQEKIDGNKPGEIRNNKDRGYQKGDFVTYHAFDNGTYITDMPIVKTEITYVTNFEQKENMVVYFEIIIKIVESSETKESEKTPF